MNKYINPLIDNYKLYCVLIQDKKSTSTHRYSYFILEFLKGLPHNADKATEVKKALSLYEKEMALNKDHFNPPLELYALRSFSEYLTFLKDGYQPNLERAEKKYGRDRVYTYQDWAKKIYEYDNKAFYQIARLTDDLWCNEYADIINQMPVVINYKETPYKGAPLAKEYALYQYLVSLNLDPLDKKRLLNAVIKDRDDLVISHRVGDRLEDLSFKYADLEPIVHTLEEIARAPYEPIYGDYDPLSQRIVLYKRHLEDDFILLESTFAQCTFKAFFYLILSNSKKDNSQLQPLFVSFHQLEALACYFEWLYNRGIISERDYQVYDHYNERADAIEESMDKATLKALNLIS